ncbi:MAG: hypothetical protein ABIW46_02035 [Acidimicrobiales bacterium]
MHPPRLATCAVALAIGLAGTAGSDRTPVGRSADPPVAVSPWVREIMASPASDEPGAALAAVLAPIDGDGWVVVGSRIDGGGDTRATIWRSADARAWTSVEVDPSPETEATVRRATGGA